MSDQPDSELLEEIEEQGARWQLRRSSVELAVWRDGVRQFGEVRRREDRSFAEFITAPISGRDDLTVTLAGLGTGQLLREILDVPGICEVQVIEESAAVLKWARTSFAEQNGNALADPRVTVRSGALISVLDAPDAPSGRFAMVLDLDASLDAPPPRAALYTSDGIARCIATLRPGGVLALGSIRREPTLLRELSTRMQNVAEVAVPSESTPGALDYLYRARRPAAGGAPRGRN
jgi:spermidine synthase